MNVARYLASPRGRGREALRFIQGCFALSTTSPARDYALSGHNRLLVPRPRASAGPERERETAVSVALSRSEKIIRWGSDGQVTDCPSCEPIHSCNPSPGTAGFGHGNGETSRAIDWLEALCIRRITRFPFKLHPQYIHTSCSPLPAPLVHADRNGKGKGKGKKGTQGGNSRFGLGFRPADLPRGRRQAPSGSKPGSGTKVRFTANQTSPIFAVG